MANSLSSDYQDLETVKNTENNNEEYKIHKENKISTKIVCNIQKPLNFSTCSLLGSLSGFEQPSINYNCASSMSEFSPIVSEAECPMYNSNKLSEPFANEKLLQSESYNEKIDKEMQSDIYLPRTKLQSIEKICVLDNTSFPYDTDFKKPFFLKYSVFEDDIAAFKDESSPNLLSTGASSLSSLTIDDDDYSENIKPNKAGIVKRKLNVIDRSQIQKLTEQKQWRQDPIGSTCEPAQISKLIDTKKILNNQLDKFLKNSLEKQEIINKKFNIYSCMDSHQHQKEHKKKIIWSGFNFNEMKKSNWNLTTNQYLKNTQNIRSEAEGNTEENPFRSELFVQNIEVNKLNNICQENQIFIDCHKAELDFGNKCGKNNKCERYKDQEFLEHNKFSSKSYQYNNEISCSVEENKELNAYEEQLLDQCIRRGMAKVTKQKISDIKPFCWDLNQICLTTRAMLKTHDENIKREKYEEYNRCIVHRGLARHITNSVNK